MINERLTARYIHTHSVYNDSVLRIHERLTESLVRLLKRTTKRRVRRGGKVKRDIYFDYTLSESGLITTVYAFAR